MTCHLVNNAVMKQKCIEALNQHAQPLEKNYYYFYYYSAHQHEAAGRKTRLDTKLWLQRQFTLLPWCCGKKPHSSLQSHGEALEKECCLPGVFCDSGDTPVSLLSELNGHLMPCTSCFYGKWVDDVCDGQFGVFVYLVLRCLIVGCCTWFSCAVRLSIIMCLVL